MHCCAITYISDNVVLPCRVPPEAAPEAQEEPWNPAVGLGEGQWGWSPSSPDKSQETLRRFSPPPHADRPNPDTPSPAARSGGSAAGSPNSVHARPGTAPPRVRRQLPRTPPPPRKFDHATATWKDAVDQACVRDGRGHGTTADHVLYRGSSPTRVGERVGELVVPSSPQ